MSDSSSSSGSESKMITDPDAEALMENFQWSIDEAWELKELLKKGDANFHTRYNGLVKQLYDDKSSFKDFRAKFPESNHAEEIQKLQEEAQSEFDYLQQLMKKKQKEKIEEFRTKFLSNIDEAMELKELLEEGDDAFQSRYDGLRDYLDWDNSIFANFRKLFPESNDAEGIQKLQEKAKSKFDDLQQLMKKMKSEEEREKEQAEVLENNFQVNIRQGREIKELLEEGDDAFQSRYNQLRDYLDLDNSIFANFRKLFPESNHAAGIQDLQDEAESEFDDLTQLKKKEKEEEEEARSNLSLSSESHTML